MLFDQIDSYFGGKNVSGGEFKSPTRIYRFALSNFPKLAKGFRVFKALSLLLKQPEFELLDVISGKISFIIQMLSLMIGINCHHSKIKCYL